MSMKQFISSTRLRKSNTQKNGLPAIISYIHPLKYRTGNHSLFLPRINSTMPAVTRSLRSSTRLSAAAPADEKKTAVEKSKAPAKTKVAKKEATSKTQTEEKNSKAAGAGRKRKAVEAEPEDEPEPKVEEVKKPAAKKAKVRFTHTPTNHNSFSDTFAETRRGQERSTAEKDQGRAQSAPRRIRFRAGRQPGRRAEESAGGAFLAHEVGAGCKDRGWV